MHLFENHKNANVVAGSTRLDRDPHALPWLRTTELLHKDLGGWHEGHHQAPVRRPDPPSHQGGCRRVLFSHSWCSRHVVCCLATVVKPSRHGCQTWIPSLFWSSASKCLFTTKITENVSKVTPACRKVWWQIWWMSCYTRNVLHIVISVLIYTECII